MKKTFLSVFALTLILASCGEEETKRRSRKKDNQKTEQLSKGNNDKKPESLIDKETMFGIIKSIPSPLETSDLIKSLGIPYSERILNDPDKRSEYTTTDKQALNLGIYGADLGFTNIYNEKSASFNYLKAVRQLANDLKIGQFFDMKTISRMQENANNMDSLLYISQRGFEQMSNYLEKQGRTDVGAQLLLGGWIEGVYLATSVYKTDPKDRIMETIGEQKVALDEIMVLINAFREKRNFQTIVKGFDKLKSVYSEIQIEYIDEKAEIEIAPGVFQEVETSKSIVKITPEQVDIVTATIEELRANIID